MTKKFIFLKTFENSGRWHLFYSWGDIREKKMKSFRGENTVHLKKDSPFTAGDRLLIWFEASPGGIPFLSD